MKTVMTAKGFEDFKLTIKDDAALFGKPVDKVVDHRHRP